MKSNDAIIVPREIWETVFACFAGHVGAAMLHRDTMPEIWADVFRFACDDDVLARLGIAHAPSTPTGEEVA